MTPENNSNVSNGDSTQSNGTTPVVPVVSSAPEVTSAPDASPVAEPTTSQATSHSSTDSANTTSSATPTETADTDVSISGTTDTTQTPVDSTSTASAQNSIVTPMQSEVADSPAPSPELVSPPPAAPVDQLPEASPGASVSLTNAKKFPIKLIIAVFVTVLLFGAVAAVAYSMGKGDQPKPVVTTPKPINLPKEAIIASECTPGRGKQYIVPKDITKGGPMYDVKNDKVIAIEYTLGLQALSANSDEFSSTILQLTKNYPVDHLSVVPEPPKLGDTDQYLHLIMFVVSKEEANSIVCPGSPTPTNPSAPATSQ